MTHAQERVKARPRVRLKVLLLVVCSLAFLAAADLIYSTIHTLSRLEPIEAQRDQWQRPSAVLQALNLRWGETVVDLGCGSGYFSLKLASAVGPSGRVIAEDIRRLPLAFVLMRSLKRGERNIHVRLGTSEDPRLSSSRADAVLILNTYHEFSSPTTILDHVRQSLVPGGRLVIVDRSPRPMNGAVQFENHAIAWDSVENDLRHAGFEIVGLDTRMIADDPDHESWWLVAARRP